MAYPLSLRNLEEMMAELAGAQSGSDANFPRVEDPIVSICAYNSPLHPSLLRGMARRLHLRSSSAPVSKAYIGRRERVGKKSTSRLRFS
jgi:hypothetical protein